MSRLVIDCSVTLAWCFADEGGDFVTDVRKRVIEEGALVPALWPFEMANGLVVAERRKRLKSGEFATFARFLAQLAIQVDAESVAMTFGMTSELARLHGLSVYDAAYLELALRRQAPLATLDAALVRAATASGVAV